MFVFCVNTGGCGVGKLLGGQDFVVAAPHSGLDCQGLCSPGHVWAGCGPKKIW